MRTLHPETEVIGSRVDGTDFVYTVMRGGKPVDVRIPKAAFRNVTPGVLGQPQRRAIVAKALGQ